MALGVRGSGFHRNIAVPIQRRKFLLGMFALFNFRPKMINLTFREKIAEVANATPAVRPLPREIQELIGQQLRRVIRSAAREQ